MLPMCSLTGVCEGCPSTTTPAADAVPIEGGFCGWTDLLRHITITATAYHGANPHRFAHCWFVVRSHGTICHPRGQCGGCGASSRIACFFGGPLVHNFEVHGAPSSCIARKALGFLRIPGVCACGSATSLHSRARATLHPPQCCDIWRSPADDRRPVWSSTGALPVVLARRRPLPGRLRGRSYDPAVHHRTGPALRHAQPLRQPAPHARPAPEPRAGGGCSPGFHLLRRCRLGPGRVPGRPLRSGMRALVGG